MAPKEKRRVQKAAPEESGGERHPDRPVPQRGPRQPRPYPDPVDDALDDSFPASDPPSWAGS